MVAKVISNRFIISDLSIRAHVSLHVDKKCLWRSLTC